MSREDYIAGRSGAKGTKKQKESKSFQAGQAERRREKEGPSKTIKVKSGKTEYEQSKEIAKRTGKDPYDTLTREEEIQAGYPKTGLETLKEASGVELVSPTLQFMGIGAKALQGLLDKIEKPEVEDFSNPNFLAVLDNAFKSGRLNKGEYTEKYKDLLDDVYGGQVKEDSQFKVFGGNLDSEDLFDLAMEEATANVEPGSGTQRITNPEGFYLDDGQGILPQTSGGLTDLAGLDVNQFTSGPGYNQKMVDMIFAAREELNRMGNQQGGGQGIMAASSTPPGIPVVPPTTPVVPPTIPVVPPVVAQTTTPFDLAQFYAGLPTFNQSPYARQGLGSYNEILRRYYG
jgi:hypothetical protein